MDLIFAKQRDPHILRTNFMADVANKYPENVAGKYYVDNQCIDCDLCRETAPDNFKRNDDGGYSFVYKQPGYARRGSALQGSQGRLPGRSHRQQRRRGLICLIFFFRPGGVSALLQQIAPQ